MMNGLRTRLLVLKAVILLASMLVLVAASSAVVFADTPFTITSGGIGYYNIVLCDNATIVEQTAANELQTYIYKVTGATLPIVGESGAQDKSFMLGPTAFAIANGVNPTGSEQWAIKNIGNKIIVTGGRTRGTLYAVYHLLEDEIGIRWWNQWEEYVPSKPTLTISHPINLSGTPAFKFREMFDATDFTGETQPYSLFNVRNRLNGRSSNDVNTPAAYGGDVSYGPPAHVHTFNRIMPPEVYYDAHPEYYALIGGERKRNGQLSLANNDVIAIFKQKIKEHIAASYVDADSKGLPRPTMFSISPNDAVGFSEDAPDLAQRASYGDSGYLLNFVNNVAADIAITYPEVKIDTLAYWYFIAPPLGGVTPASNVQIRYAHIGYDILHPLAHANNADVRSKLEAWKNITSNDMFFWNYAVNYAPNPPMPTMYNKQQDYQYLLSKGISGIFEEQEGTIHSDMWDMKIWIEAKLMENPALVLNTLITDFTDKYYGLAGSYIRQYLTESKTLTDSTMNNVTFFTLYEKYNYFTLGYVNAQELILNNAAAAVANDPVLLQRVNVARSSLDRLILIRWNDLYAESRNSGVPMNFSRQTSSTRLLNTLKQQKLLRQLGTGSVEQDINSKITDEEISKLIIPPDFKMVPYNTMIDIPSDNFTLFNNFGGLSNVSENSYLPGVRVMLSDMTDPTFRDMHKPLIEFGLYNPIDSARLLGQLSLANIIPNQYTLYKINSTPFTIKPNDYLYLFRSWSLKMYLDAFLEGKPTQTYDIYVSMNFKGPSYGGSASDPDAVYIDGVFLEGKTDLIRFGLPTENFLLHNIYGGITKDAERTSALGHAARVTLSDMTDPTFRDQHKPLIDIGLYNPTDGARLLRQFNVSDIVPNQYKLYKINSTLVTIKPNDYLYLFRSWSIKVNNLNTFLQGQPAQKYDVYLSMKFEGPSYGGNALDPDRVYIDRVILVGKGSLPTELSTVSPDRITDFSPESFYLHKGTGFNGSIFNAISLIEERASLVGRTAKTSLTSMESEGDRNYHLAPVPIGLYNSVDGARLLRQITLADITLNQYKLYKMANVSIKPNDYLYLFGSWAIQLTPGPVFSSDPGQLYDIYVSMKFEGPAYRGSLLKKDAAYIDRIIFVKTTTKYEAESLTVTAITPGVSHTITSDSNMSGGYGDKLNAFAANVYIEYSVPISETGTYAVKVKANTSTDHGIFQLAIDGTNLGAAQDTYSSLWGYAEYNLGNTTFTTTGNKLFRFTMTGKNASSSGYKLFTDYIKLIKQ